MEDQHPVEFPPAILFPDNPQASEANSVDSEPREPCNDYENTRKSVSEQIFILHDSQNSLILQAVETVLAQVCIFLVMRQCQTHK